MVPRCSPAACVFAGQAHETEQLPRLARSTPARTPGRGQLLALSAAGCPRIACHDQRHPRRPPCLAPSLILREGGLSSVKRCRSRPGPYRSASGRELRVEMAGVDEPGARVDALAGGVDRALQLILPGGDERWLPAGARGGVARHGCRQRRAGRGGRPEYCTNLAGSRQRGREAGPAAKSTAASAAMTPPDMRAPRISHLRFPGNAALMTGRWLERNEVSGPQQEPPGARHPRHGITASAGATGSRHMGGSQNDLIRAPSLTSTEARQPGRSSGPTCMRQDRTRSASLTMRDLVVRTQRVARSMLLCLSMARMTFRGDSISWVVAVVFWPGLWLGCGQDRDGPLRSGGQALIRSRPAGQGRAGDGRRIVSRPAGAAADSWVRPSPEYWRQLAGRRWGQASRAT